ncbi:hypothetical protein VP01_2338g6, partial [Puccinia sorghi]
QVWLTLDGFGEQPRYPPPHTWYGTKSSSLHIISNPPSLVDKAYTQIQSYWSLHSGLNVIWDPLNVDYIISIIGFTPFDKLTPSEKDDLNFISTFLHNFKWSISTVSSCSQVWGGLISLGLKTRLLSIFIIESPLSPPPHVDSENISKLAFVLFLPTCSSDGTVVNGPAYNVTSDPLMFPHHKSGIEFDHQHGIFKISGKPIDTHTVLCLIRQHFCRLGMSVQINCSPTNAFICYHRGFYEKAAHYFGHHFFYFLCSLGKVAAIIISLFYLTFLFV